MQSSSHHHNTMRPQGTMIKCLLLRLVVILAIFDLVFSFSKTCSPTPQPLRLLHSRHEHAAHQDTGKPVADRSLFFQSAASITIATLLTLGSGPDSALALPSSYSSNARNMERLASGDSSGGSSYDNYPKTLASQKRRAITGCKIPSARREAAVVLGVSSVSEKDCNMRVLGGDTDFMLQAIRKLECPTCPYGIDPK